MLACSLIGYEPKQSFADGLEMFLEWANENEPEIGSYDRSIEELKRRGFLHGGK